jgi:tRNA threonylcarbamoyladenosine biosynthesis protein TsaE
MGDTVPDEIVTGSAKETIAWGELLAASLAPGDVILLYGELGAGKTCLVKGISGALGIDPNRVHSPTFIMVNRYEGRLPVNHVDLYRLEEGEDFADLGLDELFAGDGVTLVEWSERLPAVARPLPRLEVYLSHVSDDQRRIRLVRLPAPAED